MPHCSDKELSYEVFFRRDGEDHPAQKKHIADDSPNWYYYWSQTDAGKPEKHVWGGEPPDVTDGDILGLVTFTNGSWETFIYEGAQKKAPSYTWNGASGIDYFANIVRHELQHLESNKNWWGNNAPDSDEDTDGDIIPDDLEDGLLDNFPYDPSDPKTYPDGGLGYVENSKQEISDNEHYTMSVQENWEAGSAADQDWAKPGSNSDGDSD